MIDTYSEERGFGVISCDSCPCEDEYEGDTWQEFYAAAKADGWRARKEMGKWVHACPACVEDFKQQQGV